MSAGTREVPNFGEVITYDRQGMTSPGLIKFFPDGDFMQLEPHEEGQGFNVSWATDLNATEALDALLDNNALNPKEAQTNILNDEGAYDYIEDESGVVVARVKETLGDKVAFFRLHGSQMAVLWALRYPRFNYTDATHNSIGVKSETVIRPTIDAYIAATALTATKAHSGETLDQFAVHVPLLRKV